jgi:hypothetical protein
MTGKASITLVDKVAKNTCFKRLGIRKDSFKNTIPKVATLCFALGFILSLGNQGTASALLNADTTLLNSQPVTALTVIFSIHLPLPRSTLSKNLPCGTVRFRHEEGQPSAVEFPAFIISYEEFLERLENDIFRRLHVPLFGSNCAYLLDSVPLVVTPGHPVSLPSNGSHTLTLTMRVTATEYAEITGRHRTLFAGYPPNMGQMALSSDLAWIMADLLKPRRRFTWEVPQESIPYRGHQAPTVIPAKPVFPSVDPLPNPWDPAQILLFRLAECDRLRKSGSRFISGDDWTTSPSDF